MPRMKLTVERERRKWSRAQLAQRADLNPGTVGLIESRRLMPYPGQLKKIADALGVPEEEAPRLLEEVGDE